jgi:hypothetical protein
MAISGRYYNDNNNNSIYDIDAKLNENLRSFLTSSFEEEGGSLRKLKDVKTLGDFYKKTREYGQQDRYGILSTIVNKIIQELLDQVEPYFIGPIIKKVDVETRFKKEGVVEVNSNIDFGAPLNLFAEFVVEVNGKESYSVKFTFQIDTSANMTNLRIISNAHSIDSIDIEALGVTIKLYLLQIEFSDKISGWSEFSLNKQMKLGEKSFAIHNLSLYAESSDNKNSDEIACSKCNTINSPGSTICISCSSNLRPNK